MEPVVSDGDEGARGTVSVALIVAVPLFVIFLVTGNRHWEPVDPFTNTLTAWTLATTGSMTLDQHVELQGTRAWIVDSPIGPVSQYPPGASALAVPLYRVFPDAPAEPITVLRNGEIVEVEVPVPNPIPALIIAAATTSLSCGIAALLAVDLGISRRHAVVGGLIFGLGTSAWTVAGDSLWQHGPNMLWIVLGMLAASRGKWIPAGLAFSALLLTRPPVVLVGIAIGIWLLSAKRWRDAAALAAWTLPGVVGLTAFNRLVHGEFGVSGGYPDQLGAGSIDNGIGWYATNVAQGLVAPDYGVFTWSPVLVVAGLGVLLNRHPPPRWAVAAALGGIGYLLLQWALNRASGGFGFRHYRYPLETIAACAPILIVGGSQAWASGRVGRWSIMASAVFSVASHAVVA